MDDYGYGGGSLLEDDLQGLLDAVDPAGLDYRGWVDVGMALAAEGVPWEVWDAWSARDAARYHAGECERKYRTFRAGGDGRVNGGTLVHMAMEAGYAPPASDDVALDWDVCEADPDDGSHGGWTLLPEGFYPFRVERMERERYQGSQKMPQCPMAKLTLAVAGTDGRETAVQQRLYITRNQLWKVSRFMESVGRGRNGAGKVIIDWGGIEGMGGFVKLKVRSYTGRDGQERQTNDVEWFVKPEEQQEAWESYDAACRAAAAQAAPAPQQQAAGYAPQASQAPQNGAFAPAPQYSPAPGAPAPQAAAQGVQPPAFQQQAAPGAWGIQ